MDDFSDWRRPYMARAHFMFAGAPVVLSEHLPKEHIADEVEPFYWPRPLRWVWSKPRGFRRGAKIERDQVVIAAGKLFMSAATWAQVQQQMENGR